MELVAMQSKRERYKSVGLGTKGEAPTLSGLGLCVNGARLESNQRPRPDQTALEPPKNPGIQAICETLPRCLSFASRRAGSRVFARKRGTRIAKTVVAGTRRVSR